MPEIALQGCRAQPLASYLKGLGVLRLVAGQADPEVRGWWDSDVFHLQTKMTETDLLVFFMEHYKPTPVVAPWNGGSGFFPGDASVGINAIESSTAERFEAYRRVISQIRKWPEIPRSFETVGEVVEALKEKTENLNDGKQKTKLEALLKAEENERQAAESELGNRAVLSISITDLEKKSKAREIDAAGTWWKEVKKIRTAYFGMERWGHKEVLLNVCRSRLPEECLPWLDATYAARIDETPVYNPLLGTGGNEGRLDFSNNFMQRIAELLILNDHDQAWNFLAGSLFSKPVSGLTKASIGQFDPGFAGGFNQGFGIETKDFKINPWDFVLTIEGSLVFSSSIVKKNRMDVHGFGAMPFTVGFSAVGFSSSQQTEKGRAEVWLPFWAHPAGFNEVQHLFGEAKCSVGRREATSGLDFSRAVGSLGVDRGIDGFSRYVFLERRGTNYVALPAGRMPVRLEPNLRLLDDLDPILRRLDSFLRGFKNIPATFESARRRIDEAMYEVCVKPAPENFSELVRAIGRVEFLFAQRDRSKKPALTKPLYGLRPEWVIQCDDGNAEVRIAAALASIRATGKVGSIRANMAGTDAERPWQWATGHGQQKWFGNSLEERLGGVLARRLIDAGRLSAPTVPVEANLEISPQDVSAFLLGETDDRLLEELLWGFTLVDWWEKGGLQLLRDRWREGLRTGPLPRGWGLLKLLHQPRLVRGEKLRIEPRIHMLLMADRAEEAVAVGYRRLRSQGLEPLPIRDGGWVDSKRQLAALLIPTGKQWELEHLVLKENSNPKKESV